MLSVLNTEVPVELPKRKRGRPKKSSTLPAPVVNIPVILKDTNYLTHAHKIVKAIMDLTRIGPFMERPDDSFYGLHDYYAIITKPIWIREICRKVGNREYYHIKELVIDVELMLENCYRFWGPNHRISRLGFMIENALEKTIKQLPEDVRLCLRSPEEQEDDEKRIADALKRQIRPPLNGHDELQGRKPPVKGPDSEQDATKTEIQSEERVKVELDETTQNETKEPVQKYVIADIVEECKDQLLEEEDGQIRKAFVSRILQRVLCEGVARERIKVPDIENPDHLFQWEIDTFQPLQKGIEINSLWQLTSIGHFLKVCGSLLDLEEVTQVEVERMLLIPKKSFTLALIMTSTLCPRFARSQLFSSPVMCYEVWNRLLRNKLELWYKIYYAHENPVKVFEKCGVEPNFWAAMGDVNPLWGKDFDQLELFQRVWILHSLCTYVLHSVKSLEEVLQGVQGEELRGRHLGRQGKYDYWSLFEPEIRVYMQAVTNPEQWDMELLTSDTVPRTGEIADYFSKAFEETGYLPPSWVYPNRKDFKLVAWDEPSLQLLIQEIKCKQIQEQLEQLVECTARHRDYSLYGLHSLYKQMNKDPHSDIGLAAKSVDYWISKNRGPVVKSPSQPKDILFGIGNQGPNLDLLYAIGKRERKRRIPVDSVLEEAEAGDGSSGSDWERERTRRSKRIRLSKVRKQEEAKRRRQSDLSPLTHMMNNIASLSCKKVGRIEEGAASPMSDSTQSCPSPPFWHTDQEEEGYYSSMMQIRRQVETGVRRECLSTAALEHEARLSSGKGEYSGHSLTIQLNQEVETGGSEVSEPAPTDDSEPDAVLNRGLRPDGSFGFYLAVGRTVLPLSDEAACRLVLLQEGISTTD